LEEVERVEALERKSDGIAAGFRYHYGQHAPKRLEDEQREFMTQLRAASRDASSMPLDVMLRFPGFPNYRKPPVS